MKNFKKIIILNFWLLTLAPLSLFAQQTGGYEITGRIKGLKEGDTIVMQTTQTASGPNQWIFKNVDSTYVKNGVFHLKGTVENGPRMYFIRLSKIKLIRVVIDNNENITLESDRDINTITHGFLENWIKIFGSPSNENWRELAPAANAFKFSIGFLGHEMGKVKDSVGFQPSIIDPLMKTKLWEITLMGRFVNEAEDNFRLGALMFSNEGFAAHYPFWQEVYSNLDDHFKNSFWGLNLKLLVPLCVGQPMPEFKLPTQDGKQIALHDIVAQSKVTLVHFFAVNSVSRQQYQDELRAMYKLYHDKGLNIIGVSSEDSPYDNQKFLAQQNFPWPNVADFKGIDGVVSTVYNEYGGGNPIHNTTNVLVDSKGKIIAWDPQGAELQWYLWKYLDNVKPDGKTGSK